MPNIYMDFLWFLIGLVVLSVGADRFVIGSSNIGRFLKIPPFVVGTVLVVYHFITRAGSIIQAMLQEKPDIALGNAFGSYIANLTLVLGVTALFVLF